MSALPTPIDVLCVGHASVDLNFSVPHYPAPDEKTVATALLTCGGGPASNAAVTVTRLGYRSAFAGYLGNDAWGDMHVRELVDAGIDTSLIVRGAAATPLSVVLIQPNGKRALINYRGDTPHLPENSVDFSGLMAKVMLFDGHEPLLSEPLARDARAKGVKTVLDAGSVHMDTRTLLSQVDYLICSEKFAREFTGETNAVIAAQRLNAFAPHVVITLGERGLVWRNAQDSGSLPAFQVEVVDTTGAGDAFHGAFAACLAANRTWRDTLYYASAVAALCCTRTGARTGIPNRREVDEFLGSI